MSRGLRGLLPDLDEDRVRLLLLAAVLLAGVFAIYAWLRIIGPLPGDRAAAGWEFRPWRFRGDLGSLIFFFDQLATPWVAAGTVLSFGLIAAENLGRRWALVVVAASFVVIPNATLKHLFGPTPFYQEVFGNSLNYPSGHVAYATALFGAVAWIGVRYRQRALAATCVVLIVLMGIDRVVSNAHLPSDVLAGYLMGGAWLCLVFAVLAPGRE